MLITRRPDIDKFLGAPPKTILAAVIHGRDRGVVRDRADTLSKKVTANPDDPFDVAVLTDGDLDGESGRLEAELTALSMMGGRRLVRLRLGSDKAGPDKMAAAALEAHAARSLNPAAFFIIEAGALDRTSALRKAAEKSPAVAAIPCYDDEPGEIARLVREGLAADKVGLDAEALDLLVSRMPHERGVVRQEVERLALWIGPGTGRTVGADALGGFLGVEAETSLSDAASDAFGGRLAAAHAGLRRAAAEGEAGAAVVRALSSHAARLRRALTLASGGMGLSEAAKASGVFWKGEREFLRQARVWTLERLDTLSAELLEADVACKTTGSPDSLIAERAALSIAGQATRLGL